jgi:hypothetical protein
MLSLLFALGRRLHQPTGLAVVVAPLALLVCCALAERVSGGDQPTRLTTQATVQQSEFREAPSPAGHLQTAAVARMSADQEVDCVRKAVGPWQKSQLARRIAERWVPARLPGGRAFLFGPSFGLGPTAPKVFDASSPEYLTLRQLRL